MRTIISIFLFIICILFLSTCGKSLDDDIFIKVNTNIFHAPLLVKFVNANYKSANKPGAFSVTISGKDSAQVVMQSGGTNYKASSGLMPLALLRQPSVANPVNFTIHASVTGYTTVSQDVTLTSDTASIVLINLIEYAQPPAGSTVFKGSGKLTNGSSAGIQLTVPPGNGVGEQATINIPAGTQVLDASHNLINASALTSTIIHYGTENQFAQSYFPGGLSPKNVIGNNGQVIGSGITFVPAGLLSINMQAGGTAVKYFSNPVQVSMGLQSALTNPVTGKTIKAGDTLSIWSMDENTGQWQYESMASITGIAGNLSINFAASHLTVWATEWLVMPESLYGVSINWTNSAVELKDKPLVVRLHVKDPDNPFINTSWHGSTLMYLSSPVMDNNYNWLVGISDPDYVTGQVTGGVAVYDGRTVIFPGTPLFPDSVILVCQNYQADPYNNYLTLATKGIKLSTTDTVDLDINPEILKPPHQDPVIVEFSNVVTQCTDKNVQSVFNGWFTVTDNNDQTYSKTQLFTDPAFISLPDDPTKGTYSINISTIYGANTYTINNIVLDTKKNETTFLGDDGNGHIISTLITYYKPTNTFVLSATIYIECD